MGWDGMGWDGMGCIVTYRISSCRQHASFVIILVFANYYYKIPLRADMIRLTPVVNVSSLAMLQIPPTTAAAAASATTTATSHRMMIELIHSIPFHSSEISRSTIPTKKRVVYRKSQTDNKIYVTN
eukprot:198303_1